MPSWRGQGYLYLDLTYKRCVASVFLFLCIKICRTCENWLTAEFTDLENDSFIFHAQFILVVNWCLRIYGRRLIRDCVSTSFIISHHVWHTCNGSAIVVALTVVVIGCTIISVLQWLTQFLLFHKTIPVATIPLNFCCRLLPQISYYSKFIQVI